MKRVSEYEFLKQDVRDGYHDAYEFIAMVRADYLNLLDQEVRESMGIFERTQYEDYIKKYITQLSPLLKGEKIKNPITGRMENADGSMLEEFEKIVEAPHGVRECEIFRQNVITAIGAYSLDNPNQPMKYRTVFPEFMTKLENHYFEQQRSQMGAINNALTLFGTDKEDRESDAAKLARRTMENMVKRFG